MTPKMIIFAGKGGVGKSSIAAACAMRLIGKGHKTLLIDYDQGHSLKTLLRLDDLSDLDLSGDIKKAIQIHGLHLVIVDELSFVPIEEHQEKGLGTSGYLKQFPGDLGLLAFCDMVTSFFGPPTAIDTTSQFLKLVTIIHSAIKYNFPYIILDVEPTAGLKRLLNSTNAIARSMKNLHDNQLKLLALTALSWPDVAHFIRGEYVKYVDQYQPRLESVAEIIRNAMFFLVTLAEAEPFRQMKQVDDIIAGFGGSTNGIVINKTTGSSSEHTVIPQICKWAGVRPVAVIPASEDLHSQDDSACWETLRKNGAILAKNGIIE